MDKKKLKLSFITPTRWIKKYGSQGDFILALAHLLPSKAGSQGSLEYENEIMKTKLSIYLDNGMFENHNPEPVESLIKKAEKIKAELFFAPDFLYDSKLTQIELDHAIALNKYYGTQIKIGAVVQGKNPDDYKNQLIKFNENPDVSLIGLSILAIASSFEAEIGKFDITESRIHLMKWMIEQKDIVWKDMHLLGIGDSYKDVIFAAENCPWIKSNDSSCAFQSGLFEKRLNDKLEVPGGKIQNKVVFELLYLTEKQEEYIQNNIDIIKKVLK